MWFVADRDERDDRDVQQMAARLGDRAFLRVLQRRELENYLLDPSAIAEFLNEKAGKVVAAARGVAGALREAAAGLRERVVALRLMKRLLAPLYIQSREKPGSVEERLAAGKKELDQRIAAIGDERASIAEEIDRTFQERALEVVPGTLILDTVATGFGLRFLKEKGDSLRLARHLGPGSLSQEIVGLLDEICSVATH